MSAKPKRPGEGALPDDEAARIAAARRKVKAILRKAAPSFALGEGPLNKLAIYLQNAPWTDWDIREKGRPDTDKHLKRLEKKSAELLAGIECSPPDGGTWLILRMNAARKALGDLISQIQREREDLPKAEGAGAWKGWAHIFYDLAVQTWLEGGEPFWRGERRNFGVHPGGKATRAVQGLLAMAMKDRPSRKPPSAVTISEYLIMLPDTLPFVDEPTGIDLPAYADGVWDYDGFRRLNLNKFETERKSSENAEQKKRGRPRGK